MQQLAVTLTSTGSKVRVLEQKQQPATAIPGQAAFATEENCHLGTNEGQQCDLVALALPLFAQVVEHIPGRVFVTSKRVRTPTSMLWARSNRQRWA